VGSLPFLLVKRNVYTSRIHVGQSSDFHDEKRATGRQLVEQADFYCPMVVLGGGAVLSKRDLLLLTTLGDESNSLSSDRTCLVC